MEKQKQPIQKKEKVDTSIFGGKSFITRQQLRESARKNPFIPDSGGTIFKDRLKKAEERFKKSGSHITKQEGNRMLKKIREEKYRAKTGTEKLALDREGRYYKKLFGL